MDKDPASLGITNEVFVPISGADHRTVCKFDRSDGQKYKPVYNSLAAMANYIEKSAVSCT